jgi:hypothetical protein
VTHQPLAAGTTCSDGNVCNGVETCNGAGACVAGTAPALDDGNPCTADACDPSAGVTHQPLAAGASCSDGNACNGGETCDGAGICLAGVAPVVDDDRDACTVDACDPAVGVTHAVIPGCIESFAEAAARLYTGSGAVQLGVQPGAIDPALVAVVRGKVLLRGGGPLAGVAVGVFDHPELGHTNTRADGGFEMAVNGGDVLVLRYSAAGSPTADRSVDVVKHAYVTATDVAVVPYDFVTVIMPSVPAAQVARAARVIDANGTRQALLIFQPSLTATLELPDGGVLPLGPFRARTTEFTVGTAGPQALPAELPAGFDYQYAAEPSVDEAIAAGADVVFNTPVALYVEDYRGFPTGARLPISRYDRTIAAWVPHSDGMVLKLLGTSGGVALVDVNGDGVAEPSAALSALGIGTPELQQLARFYPQPGKVLWRASMVRFGPLAFDWP